MIGRIPKSFKQACETAFVPLIKFTPTRLVAVALACTSVAATAGEIAGLPANTPPSIQAPLSFSFSNDLLGRGATSDDFRTQQFIISGTIAERWDVTLDHSLMTLVDGEDPGRTDQLTVTLGYRVINEATDTAITRLTAGAGVRGYGDFAGERIQNGFHQLVRSGTEEIPYTDLDRTDGVAWADAQRYALFKGSRESADWRWGYWLRASALWASDGQLDSALGAYAVGGKRSIEFWLGLRQDWRTGYEEPVLKETAASEQALAAVIGLRWGPLVFETVQQFDGDGSYGQVRLLATGFDRHDNASEISRFVVDAGVMVPDVHASLTGRWRAPFLDRAGASWQPSLFVTAVYGEPQYDDDPEIYLRATHAGIGVEWERRLSNGDGWSTLYASVGAGWREEKVFGDATRVGEKSDSVSEGIVLGGIGIRINAAEFFEDFNLRIQLGLTGWVPFSDAEVEMAGETFRVQEPTVAIAMGLTIGRFAGD